MKCTKVTSDDGVVSEKFSSNALLLANGADGSTFRFGELSTIRQNANTTTNLANPTRVIGDPNKTAYWHNVEVVYDDRSTSTLAYVDAVAIDAMRFSPTNDFLYFGIPLAIAKRILSCAQNLLGCSNNTAYLERNTSDGYVWSSTKIDDKHLDGCYCYANKGRVRIQPAHLCEEYKKAKRNILCHALIQFKIKAYVPKTTADEDVKKQPWTIGGTLVQINAYGDTTVRSPGSTAKQTVDGRTRRPKGTVVSELCSKVASMFLVDESTEASEAAAPSS